MTKLALSQKLNASADEVWALVGGFNNLAEFHEAVANSEIEGGGALRRLHVAGGPGQLVERLLKFDDAARSYSYTIVDTVDFPLQFTNYFSTVRVKEDPSGGSVVEWEGSADLNEGASEQEVLDFWRFIYETGFKGLAARFGG